MSDISKKTDMSAIQEYFTGYLDVVFEDGYYFLYRFGEAQRKFYDGEGEFYGRQSRYCAGIKINAEKCRKIEFDFICKKSEIESFVIGISHSNGEVQGHRVGKDDGHVQFLFNDENVILYFPYDAELGFKNIDIIAERGYKSERIIAAFGDSITQGYMSENPSVTYLSYIAEKLRADAYNFGVSGYFMRKGILGELEQIPKPWIILFAYGTNDWHFEQNYQDELPGVFVELHKCFADTPVFVILPIARMSENTEINKNGKLEDVRNFIETEAKKYDNFYVIKRGTELDVEKELRYDGIHPNDEGMMHLGDVVFEEISKRKEIF